MDVKYQATPPDRAEGASGPVLGDIKGRLRLVVDTFASAISSAVAPAADAVGMVVRVAGRVFTDAGVWAYAQPATGLLSDSTDLATSARGLRILAAGDVKYETIGLDGSTRFQFTETFTADQVPDVIPVQVVRIYNSGTTVAAASIQIGV